MVGLLAEAAPLGLAPSIDVVVRPWRNCGASMPEMVIRRRVLRRAYPDDGGGEGLVWIFSRRGMPVAKPRRCVRAGDGDGDDDRIRSCWDRHDAQINVARELIAGDDKLLRANLEALCGKLFITPRCVMLLYICVCFNPSCQA